VCEAERNTPLWIRRSDDALRFAPPTLQESQIHQLSSRDLKAQGLLPSSAMRCRSVAAARLMTSGEVDVSSSC
jgi:hypothetical protein